MDNSFCTENGTVKIIWDYKYIYVGTKLYDSDIVQEGDKDWEHHYLPGDVMEVFLKPNGSYHDARIVANWETGWWRWIP